MSNGFVAGEALEATSAQGRPPLYRRVALAAWHALWWLLFAAALAAFVATAAYYAPRQAVSEARAEATLADFGLYSMDLDYRLVGPANDRIGAAGVSPRSVILAIDDKPITSSGDVPEVLGRATAGTLDLRLIAPDGTQREVTLRRAPGEDTANHPSEEISLIANAVTGVLFGAAGLAALAVAFLLFRRRPDELTPALISSSALIFGLSTMFGSLASAAVLGQGAVGAFSTVGFATFALGLARFPRPGLPPRWGPFVAVLAPVMLFSWEFAELLPESARSGVLLSLELLSLCLLVVMLAIRYRSLPAGEVRQQLGWAILGQAAGTALIMLSAVLQPAAYASVNGWERLGWSFAYRTLSSLGMAMGWFGVLVSLLKYRLYDAEAAISRTVSIGALTIVLLAVFAGTEKVIELLGEEWFGHSIGVLAGGIGAALAAALLVPLHHRLSHWAEHKFQKQLIRLKHGLPLLVGDMRETAPVARIAAATLDSIGHGVRASRTALVFEGAMLDARGIEADEVERWRQGWNPPLNDGFDIDKADALFPLRVPLAADGHGRIGWLLLGPRPDGSFYGKDERETLAEIADPVARALEIAATREKREAEEAQRWRAQESLNAEIRSVNGELVRVLGSLDARLAQLVPLPPAEAAE